MRYLFYAALLLAASIDAWATGTEGSRLRLNRVPANEQGRLSHSGFDITKVEILKPVRFQLDLSGLAMEYNTETRQIRRDSLLAVILQDLKTPGRNIHGKPTGPGDLISQIPDAAKVAVVLKLVDRAFGGADSVAMAYLQFFFGPDELNFEKYSSRESINSGLATETRERIEPLLENILLIDRVRARLTASGNTESSTAFEEEFRSYVRDVIQRATTYLSSTQKINNSNDLKTNPEELLAVDFETDGLFAMIGHFFRESLSEEGRRQALVILNDYVVDHADGTYKEFLTGSQNPSGNAMYYNSQVSTANYSAGQLRSLRKGWIAVALAWSAHLAYSLTGALYPELMFTPDEIGLLVEHPGAPLRLSDLLFKNPLTYMLFAATLGGAAITPSWIKRHHDRLKELFVRAVQQNGLIRSVRSFCGYTLTTHQPEEGKD